MFLTPLFAVQFKYTGKLQRFMQENLRISISKATLIVFGLTFLGQVIGFFSQMILANFFGVGNEIDSYVVSSIFPEFIFGITNAVFVVALVALLPDYIKKKGVDKKDYFIDLERRTRKTSKDFTHSKEKQNYDY